MNAQTVTDWTNAVERATTAAKGFNDAIGK